MELVDDTTILYDISNFICRIAALEREKCTHIYSKRSDFRADFSLLEEIDTKANDERKTESLYIKRRLLHTFIIIYQSNYKNLQICHKPLISLIT